MLGASSATALPLSEQDVKAAEAAAPVDETVLRADQTDWVAWKAGKVAEEAKAALEAEARRPHAVQPTAGILTSTFGQRWGAMHAGIDLAGPIGTPIVSAADGTVIEAGPASGFGLWVRVQQDDGTIAVYGHVNEMMVAAGQKVRAGDLIATIGNRGQSTGPHLHFEIWAPDGTKTDPLIWLVQRGIQLIAPAA